MLNILDRLSLALEAASWRISCCEYQQKGVRAKKWRVWESYDDERWRQSPKCEILNNIGRDAINCRS